MDLQEQIDVLRGNQNELLMYMNTLNNKVESTTTELTARVDKTYEDIASCWNKDNYRRERGVCQVSVTPSKIGIDRNRSIVRYNIEGSKCYIDMYIIFDGTGTGGVGEELRIHLLPTPGVPYVERATLPMIMISSAARQPANKPCVLNIDTENNFFRIAGDVNGGYQELTTADIKAGTGLRGQFWYELPQN